MFKIINNFYKHIEIRRKYQMIFLLFIMIVSMFAEMVSIGSIVPFLGALVSPEMVYSHHLMQFFVDFFNVKAPNEIVKPIVIVFATLTVVSALIRLLLLYLINKVSYYVGHDISIKIFYNSLHTRYIDHLLTSSSEMVNAVIVKTRSVIYGILLPLLTLISSAMILMGIVFMLIYINPFYASIGIALSIIFYFFIMQLMKPRLKVNSNTIAIESTKSLRILQEGIGGIRDVIINNNSSFFLESFRDADLKQRNAEMENNFITESPRYIMEAVGILLIIALAYSMLMTSNESSLVVPILGAVALGAQRLLPALQVIYQSITNMRAMKSSSSDVVDLLNNTAYLQEGSCGNSVDFSDKIELKMVGFSYPGSDEWVFKNINLTFYKGQKIGVIGQTGVGKSTFIDIVMGLIPITSGDMLIDGVRLSKSNLQGWQSKIAHVPQHIFIYDSSIKKNIAFGIDANSIDNGRVAKSAEMAKISNFISGINKKYDFMVGESGCRLSGGQRQRVGLARAFYKKSEILILDESTSALDSETEKEILSEINNLKNDCTVFMITHKHSILKYCDIIVQISQNGKVEVVNYNDVL